MTSASVTDSGAASNSRASGNDLSITTTASVTINGRVQAGGALDSSGNITSGIIMASGNLTVRPTRGSSDLNVTNSGLMQAGGTLDLSGFGGSLSTAKYNLAVANNGSGLLLGDTLLINGNSLTNKSNANMQGTSDTRISR